jgi:FAD:protein FMN transferase
MVDDMIRDGFRVMGSAAQVVLVGGRPEQLADARTLLDHLHHRWSRFEPASDISRLNNSPGASLTVDPSTVRLVVAMVDAWRATGGAFDPTLLPSLLRAGYDTSWEDASRSSAVHPDSHWRGQPERILVDVERSVVELPAGTTIDAGGIGKGLGADMCVEMLLAGGAAGALVCVGGDLRVAGEAPREDGWHIGVDDPFREGDAASVALADGGIATSSALTKAWTTPTGDAHHMIDPDDGHPSREPIASSSVVAGSAAWAEAWSKVAYVRGITDTLAALDAIDLGGLCIGENGHIRHNGAWARYER